MLYLRVSVMALAMAMVGAAYFQDKIQDKKPEVKKPVDKAPPIKVKGTLPQYYKKIGLRDDQIQKVYKIRGESRAKQDEHRREIDRIKAEEKASLEKVLTPEQLKRLRELRTGEKPSEK